MADGKTCSHCGCTIRKVIPILIIENGLVSPMGDSKDDPNENKKWGCPVCGNINRE